MNILFCVKATQGQLRDAQELGQRFLLASEEMTAKVSEKDSQITELTNKMRALQEDHAKISGESSELAEKLDEVKKLKETEVIKKNSFL